MNKSIFIKILFTCIFLLIANTSLLSQNKYHTKSKKAIKYFESALQKYKLKYFEQAKADLAKAISIDKQFVDVFILSAEIANEEGFKEKAIENYSKAIAINKDYNPLMFLRKADLEKETGKYQQAIADYETYLSYNKFTKEIKKYVLQKVEQCKFALELKKKPVEFSPQNLGASINTNYSEYWPSLTADDSTLVFTSSDRKINSQEDLFYSTKKNGKWQKSIKIGAPVNSGGSEGAQSISADGKTMVFTACLRADGYGSCDLYISKKKGDKWSVPVNIGGPINTPYKESQPSLSADGKTLYFASNRPNGKGMFDIWISSYNNKSWTQPVNLGDSINTNKDELAPFIHYDNQTLYFSSEGHPGMGGSDMFISRKKQNGEWAKAKNLGYPINTHFNEESIIVTADANFGMFSSNMKGGFGQKDIYQFLLPPEAKPNKTIFIKGLVFNAKNNQPLQAEINIYGENEKQKTQSDRFKGEFLSCLAPKKSYMFHVEKPGYMIYSENFSLPDSSIYIRIPLQPIEVGISAILKNIFFEYDSYKLKPESYPELDWLKDFINTNNISIEIQGHTDNEGTETYNQKLSTNRAKSVYDYLIKAGIKKEKINYKGYGFKKPIASNQTEKGRAKNRRTEFKILSVK